MRARRLIAYLAEGNVTGDSSTGRFDAVSTEHTHFPGAGPSALHYLAEVVRQHVTCCPPHAPCSVRGT